MSRDRYNPDDPEFAFGDEEAYDWREDKALDDRLLRDFDVTKDILLTSETLASIALAKHNETCDCFPWQDFYGEVSRKHCQTGMKLYLQWRHHA